MYIYIYKYNIIDTRYEKVDVGVGGTFKIQYILCVHDVHVCMPVLTIKSNTIQYPSADMHSMYDMHIETSGTCAEI